MKTETEFQDKLKICLRRARKGMWPIPIARKMGYMSPGVYFAYEVGDLKLSAYQLYQFMHATGQDAEFAKQIFDDNWNPPSMHKSNK